MLGAGGMANPRTAPVNTGTLRHPLMLLIYLATKEEKKLITYSGLF